MRGCGSRPAGSRLGQSAVHARAYAAVHCETETKHITDAGRPGPVVGSTVSGRRRRIGHCLRRAVGGRRAAATRGVGVKHRDTGEHQWHALPVLRQLDDGAEITAEAGLGSAVRLRSAERPWNDKVLDLRCELADDGVSAVTWLRTLNGDGTVSWAAADLAGSYEGRDGVRAVVTRSRPPHRRDA